MAGSYNLFDGQDLTASSEYSSRGGRAINTLQIHHGTIISFEGLKSLMWPGGRQVSANGAMSNTGYLDEVVPLHMRAFTSASSADQYCFTVEVCNTTLGPQWGISHASRERLARLAVDMYRAGLLGSLTRAHIIGHYEVPGTYATACPGPDMNLDWIVARANEIYAGVTIEPETESENDMGILYYANDGAWPDKKPTSGTIDKDGIKVVLDSMWFQESPGAPLFDLTDGLPYNQSPAVIEHLAFVASPGAAYKGVSTQQLWNLIKRRGKTTKPIGNFAGSVSVGDIEVPADPAALAILKSIDDRLAALPAEIDRYADGRKQAA